MNGITERDVLTTETEDLEQQAKRKAGLFDDNEMARKITEGFKQNNPNIKIIGQLCYRCSDENSCINYC